ncbi:hypothetical protein HYZ76_02215, partial [Candidatus Falkowbacteria bacterium]|nr:hypothetical protein [Candidatus Falkowbacteria bacterium]
GGGLCGGTPDGCNTYVDQNLCEGQSGCLWSGGGYPTDKPDIYPIESFAVPSIAIWSSFTEIATKNGGEIYYQLSDDGGITWYYWNGFSWVAAGINNYNTASVVNSNIRDFSIANQQILFRAFLASNGSQQVQLDEVRINCSEYYDWSFTLSSDYNYNPNEIEITDGVAQLLGSGGLCGGAPEACNSFGDQNLCEGQSGCLWDESGSSCQNAGSCLASSAGQCNRCGGAGCSRSGSDCSGTLDCFVYTDQASCQNCGQCAWVGGGGLCGGTPDGCNTYVDQNLCEGQSGCLWSGGGYPINSNIQPVVQFSAPKVNEYTFFEEIATKNGGEIYYQLSDDGGTTWYYWNGSSWSAAGLGQYSTAVTINNNISLFPTSTQEIMFKAFLTGDGSQQVQLDNVRIGWGEPIGAGYAISGTLESSAFNTGGQSSFHFISWRENIPSVAEDIKVQLATAPDAGGLPGAWSDWQGLEGFGTFYDSGQEVLIPLNNGHNNNQWIKYQVILTGSGSDTPVLEEIIINYTP